MITLFILTLLLMSSGVVLLFYTTIVHPSQLRARATATIQAVVNANATVNAQTTGTAVAEGHATATAQAQATVAAQATTTTQQNIYNSATGGVPALDNSLAFQTDANWDTYDTQDGGGCHFTGGALHSSVFQNGYYVPCFALATSFSNFALETQVTFIKGDEGGVILRGDNQTNKFYSFSITEDGHYSFDMQTGDTHTTPLDYEKSSAINTTAGQPNTLTVVARANNFYLYINKQFITTISDSTYSSGEIGLFASDQSNATDVAFSNLRAWNL